MQLSVKVVLMSQLMVAFSHNPKKKPSVKLQARTADVADVTVDSRGFFIEAELNASVKGSVFKGVTTGVK